jgi:hypothetical protein
VGPRAGLDAVAKRKIPILKTYPCLYAFFPSALDGSEWSASRPGRFTPRERDPGTQWIVGFTKKTAHIKGQ